MAQKEIAERLGVTGTRAYQIVSGSEFPLPTDKIGVGKVWLLDDVEAWICDHRPHQASEQWMRANGRMPAQEREPENS